ILFGVLSSGFSGLVVNEVFRGRSVNHDYVEFLVTSDISLGQLDTMWFGDSRFSSWIIESENNFSASQIISNSSYFSSSSDVIKAGTLLSVGGSQVGTDFNYNPNTPNVNDNDAWNITLGAGQGFNTSPNSYPFDLDRRNDVVWVASAQPTWFGDTSNFTSALAFARDPGYLAAQVGAIEASGNDAFQLITPPEFDGNLPTNRSLSNMNGAAIDFSDSEMRGGTIGVANSASNLAAISSLRAVPEPSTILLLVAGLVPALWIRLRKRRNASATVTP
ncbi:MAG: PEP-CTERM sorting domain-containing protein, partial [Verrucomicrobiota bacterium]